jgi:hypothetical protein
MLDSILGYSENEVIQEEFALSVFECIAVITKDNEISVALSCLNAS